MPASQRHTPLPLIGRLLQRPQQFEFFQAVRVVKAWTDKTHDRSIAAKPRTVWFHNRISMSFPSSDIESIKVHGVSPGWSLAGNIAPPEGAWVAITPSFMGLLGSTGTLPYGFTDAIAFSTDSDGRVPAEFFDILSQRSLSLFCDAWARARVTYQFDRTGRNQLFPSQLSLAGLTRSGPENGNVSNDVRTFYAGILRKRSVSAAVLGQVLSHYFDATITVLPCIGEWSHLAPDEQSVLGLTKCTLGEDALVGARTYQRDHRVRIRIGPLSTVQYREFAPRSNGADALMQMLTCFPVTHLKFELNVVLRDEDVRTCVLDAQPPRDLYGSGLGLSTFLGEPGGRDRDDLLFDLTGSCKPVNGRGEIGA